MTILNEEEEEGGGEELSDCVRLIPHTHTAQ